MKSIALFNNKGGVGKTTSVINIAYVLGEKKGKNVLVIDCDGQKNCSRFFSESEKQYGIENTLLYGDSCIQCFSKTRYKNIDILVSTEKLNSIIGDFEKLPRETQLANAQKLFNNTEKQYDYILLDLSPSMNIINETLMMSCDSVIVPIELGTFAIQGIANVTETLNRIKAKFGGCFVTKFDKNNPADFSLLELLKGSLGNKTFNSLIPFSRVIKNSISYKLTACEYMDWTAAVDEYVKLTEEIIERV